MHGNIELRSDERGEFLAYLFDDGREFHFEMSALPAVEPYEWKLAQLNKWHSYAYHGNYPFDVGGATGSVPTTDRSKAGAP